MKKYLINLLFIVLFLALCISVPRPKVHDVSIERRATHMITFVQINELTGEEKETQNCTSTAVGPHALLTDTHCIAGQQRTIHLDLSPVVYTVIGAVTDGRDHVILHIVNFEFKTFVSIRQREPRMGESVRVYGTGGNDFPAHVLFGKVIPDDYEGDLSEVDSAIGTTCYSLGVIGGDSGSAIYGADGYMLGTVSLGRGEHDHTFDYATGFSLNFSPEVLEMIKQ